jgi:hypothetical protein
MRHKHLTHFNGYIYVDPTLREGEWAILDAGFAEEKVYVHRLGRIFATVSLRPYSSKWDAMICRLTRVEEKHGTGTSTSD